MYYPVTSAPSASPARPQPFDSADWIFEEIKFDGFRALAFIEDGQCQLVSRNGHPFRFPNLSDAIANSLKVQNAVVDGEIVCLDHQGRSVFDDLFSHRGEPFFYAFDLLWLNGQDMRELPLIERKAGLASYRTEAEERAAQSHSVSRSHRPRGQAVVRAVL